ncbi:unnamed protein product [Camellia sinensis]
MALAKRLQMVHGGGSCLIRWRFHTLIFVLGAVLVTLAAYHSTDSKEILLDYYQNQNQTKDYKSHDHVNVVDHSLLSRCDLFSGKWVYDHNKSYPLYKDRECKFMFDDLACEKFGRKDLNYQHWRWQPHGCDLPRFNAKALLERLRGKRLVFVGDSVNRNQWVSMVCLLDSSIPKPLKYMHLNGPLYTFKATEYNASIDFYWSPLLVESNSDNPSNHSLSDRIVRIKAIEKHARQWGDADVLVFNSYLWWRIPKLKVLRGSFESPNQVYQEVNALQCYKMALKTWSNWLDTHVNRTKTQLFFVSMTATHSRAEEWGMPKDQNCLNETRPIEKEGFWGSGSEPRMMRIIEGAISKLKSKGLKIQMLNITQLSEYRKDGHPSIYRKQWRPLTKEQLSNPRNYADCTHWCLPGVPDVLVLGIVNITRDSKRWIDDKRASRNDGSSLLPCNLFLGKWVYDNKSYPLYTEQHCTFKFIDFSCESGGRKDLNYQHWRWQPYDCDLPRFNAMKMLEGLRGKRLVFVGDSLTRNQWASMVCLLESFIPQDLKNGYPNGNFVSFKIMEYNASIEHYWAPFLVESSSDHPTQHDSSLEQIVRVQAIEKHARQWTDADILVFNSYLWWRRPKLKVLWGSFEDPDGIYKEVEMLRTYEMALKTWSNWLEIHVNCTKTQLFFVTMSPTHQRGEEWGKLAGQTCYNETEPISKEGHWGSQSYPKMMHIVEEAINGLARRGVKVQILNITQLSEYRKEGHPSIYYSKPWKPLIKAKLANPTKYSDCVHWCLPGVPDVWNELLYAYIFHYDKFKEKLEL